MIALGVAAYLMLPTSNQAVAGAPVISVPGENVTVSFVGDTLLGDEAAPLIEANGPGWVLERLEPFPENDVVIANLEGPVTDAAEPADPTQRWSYNAAPETVAGLSEFGVDAVSLANNHAMDRGLEGLNDTRLHATNAGIVAFGAGAASPEARMPVLIDGPNGRIAVVGLADVAGSVTASSDRPGTRRLSLNNIQVDHEAARRAGADYVIAFVHWGDNYGEVTDRQRTLAQVLVDTGYDLVVGAGAHLVQPIEIIDGTPVLYSVGNFVFGTPGRYHEQAPGYSVAVRATFDFDQLIDLELSCIETDNAVVNYQPRSCPPSAADQVLTSLHPDVAFDGQRGHLTVSR